MSQETLTQIVGIMLEWSAETNQVLIDKLYSDQQEQTALHESQVTHLRNSWEAAVNGVTERAKEEKEHLESQVNTLTAEIDGCKQTIDEMRSQMESIVIEYTKQIDSLTQQLEIMRLDRTGQNNPAT